MSIVVTGFGPFGDFPVNISWESVKELLKLWNEDKEMTSTKLKLETEEMEVAFEHVRQRTPDIWEKYKPCLMVHVGVHGFTEKILLEECAFNSSYTAEDVRGCICDLDGCCVPGGEECLHTRLDLDKVKSVVKAAGVKIDISKDPGHYLCGFIYYRSLTIDPHRSIFVHVPPEDHGATPKDLAQSLLLIIKELLRQLELL